MLIQEAKQEIGELSKQTTLFTSDNDYLIEQVFSTLQYPVSPNFRHFKLSLFFRKLFEHFAVSRKNIGTGKKTDVFTTGQHR